MRQVFAIVICLLTIAGCDLKPVGPPPIAPKSVDTSNVIEQAEIVSKAFLERDWETLANCTHPDVIRAMGGRVNLIESAKAMMRTADNEGMQFIANDIGKPSEPVVDSGTGYVILPSTLRCMGPGVHIVTESYLLAISDDGGKTWKFADGAGLSDPEVRKKVLPRLPPTLNLPEKKKPVITNDKK